MTFASDLAFSQKYENELKNLIKGYVSVETSQDKGLFKEWDVRFTYEDGHTESHEVKCDRNGYKTGNVVIEFECSGKPSGILTTKSDYYSFFVISPNGDYTCIILETEHVRKQIFDKKYTRIIDMRGGGNNDNNGRLYLFNIDTLIGECSMEDYVVSDSDSGCGMEDYVVSDSDTNSESSDDEEKEKEKEKEKENEKINNTINKTKCTVFAP